MNQTVVGVFNSYEAAERAAAELSQQGIERSAMQIKATESGGDTTTMSTAGSSSSTSGEDTGVMASMRHFFAELFGEDDHAANYTEAVRRGRAVLTVEADENRIDTVREALGSAGAVDIDEQVSSWRSQGWSGSDADAAPHSRQQAAAERENVLPVVEESLEVGKRQVSGGAVRVVSRVVSRPVSESVELRREEAVVERRPVDREATEADLAAFQERTVEVTEMAEKAVVNKTARVVEEVVVGKQVSSETQVVEDNVRHTEVDVERVGGDSSSRSGSVAGAIGGGGSAGSIGGDHGSVGSSGGSVGGGGSMGASGGSMGGSDDSIGTRGGSVGAGGSSGGSGGGSVAGGFVGSGVGGAVGGSDAGMAGGQGSLGGGMGGGVGGGFGSGVGSATSAAGSMSGRRNFSDYEDEFRQDYQTNFASSGGSYEDFQPAYRGGYEWRGDSRYANRQWDDVEPQLRQHWESEHPGSAWERVKAAVRRGWDRATS